MHVRHELSMTIQHEDVIKILIPANRGRCRYALVRIVISTLRSKVPDIIFMYLYGTSQSKCIVLSGKYLLQNRMCGPKRCLTFVF